MSSPRVITTIVATLLLAGCSLFTPEKPEGSTPVTAEEGAAPSDVTETERQSDVDSCREQARAVVRQDENISADISSRDDQGAFFDDSPDLTRNMDAYESQQRYHRVFEDCMRGRGYVDEAE